MLQPIAPLLLAALCARSAPPGSVETAPDVVPQTWILGTHSAPRPNPFDATSSATISMTLVGTPRHDVADIDPSTIRIWAEHGAAGSLAPLRYDYDDRTGPSAPGADGILDLNFRFRMSDVRSGLKLGSCPSGSLVKVFVGAKSSDGRGILGSGFLRAP